MASNSFVENAIRAEAHRGFVGIQIWCVYCGGILDCRKSVSLDLFTEDRTLVMSKIVCIPCFDRYCDLERVKKSLGAKTLEVFNGGTNEFMIVKGE